MKRYETDVRDGVLYLEAPVSSADEDGSGDEGGAGDGADGEEDHGEDTPDGAGAAESDDEGTNATDADDRWLEIGPMDAIVDLVGGETYELQYDRRQKQVGWLDTDEDGTLSFDVRETVRTTTFDDEFVRNVAGVPADGTTEDGQPQRAAVFADLLTTIWDSKGNLEDA